MADRKNSPIFVEAGHGYQTRPRDQAHLSERRVQRPLLRFEPQPDHLPDLRLRLQDRLLPNRPCRGAGAEEKAARKVKKEEVVEKVVAEGETEEALADVEADEAVAEDEDETFLEEEEEEGGDVSNIIGGPVAEGEEP